MAGTRFLPGTRRSTKKGPFPGRRIPGQFCLNRIAISKNLIRLRATGSRSPARAHHAGGSRVRWMRSGRPAMGPPRPAPRYGQPPHPTALSVVRGPCECDGTILRYAGCHAVNIYHASSKSQPPTSSALVEVSVPAGSFGTACKAKPLRSIGNPANAGYRSVTVSAGQIGSRPGSSRGGRAKGNAAMAARTAERAADLLPLILPMKAGGASVCQIGVTTRK
jgi:hypothetical protein